MGFNPLGAITGGLSGFAMGGPLGALAGGLGGAFGSGGARSSRQIQYRPRKTKQVGQFNGIPVYAMEPDPIQMGETAQGGGSNPVADMIDLFALGGTDGAQKLWNKYRPAADGTQPGASYGVLADDPGQLTFPIKF